ncbi:RNA polymerase sigma factor [Gemmatimonas sp.]|jgi:RNA polymerase sigma-70 factor (ECF subfamily)|uniref:RNA polymerase sigma factor n=1 Tax=Gemmatimonas sp. TaxID=1962908 RepID=UPI0037C08425
MNALPLPSVLPPTAPDVAAVRAGNPDALAAVYHQHAAAMLTLALRLTASRADAEDVVHDVFVALPEALAHYEERGQFRAWLMRLTTRVALMHERRTARLERRDSLDGVATVGDVERDVLVADHVYGALRTLKPALRHVFVLRVLHELPHAEIARVLGISISASEVRLHRGIQQLRQLLRRLA